MGLDIRQLIKECVTQVLREELEDPLYVEYHSQRQGEEPFMMHGQKFEYVNAIYPNGKIDIAVYAFAGDMVYSYNAFRKMYNLAEATNPATFYKRGAKGKRTMSDMASECPMCHGRGVSLQDPRYKCTSCRGTGKLSPPKFTEAFDPTSVGPNPEASEGLSDGNPYAVWNAKMRTLENLPLSGEEKYRKQQPGGEMSAVNTSEAMGRYAQEAGADGFGVKEFAVNEWETLDAERRKKQLSVRPHGYETRKTKMRSDQMAKDTVDRMKQQHQAGS
jgi:hypothetical protein